MRVAAGAALALAGAGLAGIPASSASIFGFASRSAAMERAVERRFMALPSPDRVRDFHA